MLTFEERMFLVPHMLVGTFLYHQQNDDEHIVYTMHTLRNTERTNVRSDVSLLKEYD